MKYLKFYYIYFTLGFICKSSIHFYFILVYDVSCCPVFHFFTITIPVIQTAFIEETVFIPLYAIVSFGQILTDHKFGLFLSSLYSVPLINMSVLITVALLYSLILGIVFLTTLFFFLKIIEKVFSGSI